MIGGYIGKILYVHLSNRVISEKEITESMKRKFIGGVGLGAKILYDETDGSTDPLSEKNVLIFFSRFLA